MEEFTSQGNKMYPFTPENASCFQLLDPSLAPTRTLELENEWGATQILGGANSEVHQPTWAPSPTDSSKITPNTLYVEEFQQPYSASNNSTSSLQPICSLAKNGQSSTSALLPDNYGQDRNVSNYILTVTDAGACSSSLNTPIIEKNEFTFFTQPALAKENSVEDLWDPKNIFGTALHYTSPTSFPPPTSCSTSANNNEQILFNNVNADKTPADFSTSEYGQKQIEEFENFFNNKTGLKPFDFGEFITRLDNYLLKEDASDPLSNETPRQVQVHPPVQRCVVATVNDNMMPVQQTNPTTPKEGIANDRYIPVGKVAMETKTTPKGHFKPGNTANDSHLPIGKVAMETKTTPKRTYKPKGSADVTHLPVAKKTTTKGHYKPRANAIKNRPVVEQQPTVLQIVSGKSQGRGRPRKVHEEKDPSTMTPHERKRYYNNIASQKCREERKRKYKEMHDDELTQRTNKNMEKREKLNNMKKEVFAWKRKIIEDMFGGSIEHAPSMDVYWHLQDKFPWPSDIQEYIYKARNAVQNNQNMQTPPDVNDGLANGYPENIISCAQPGSNIINCY